MWQSVFPFAPNRPCPSPSPQTRFHRHRRRVRPGGPDPPRLCLRRQKVPRARDPGRRFRPRHRKSRQELPDQSGSGA